jgi:hypothetical protein
VLGSNGGIPPGGSPRSWSFSGWLSAKFTSC